MDHLLNTPCVLETRESGNEGGIQTNTRTAVEGNFKCRIGKRLSKYYDRTEAKLIAYTEDVYQIFLSVKANGLLKKEDRIKVGSTYYYLKENPVPKEGFSSIHHLEVLAYIKG